MVHVLAIHVYACKSKNCERHAHCNLPSEQILGVFFHSLRLSVCEQHEIKTGIFG